MKTTRIETPNHLFVVPALDIDRELFATRPMLPHTKIERRIAASLIAWMDARGWKVDAVNDGDTVWIEAKDVKTAMEAIASVDDSHLRFRAADGRTSWVQLIGGNGEDFISDYSCKHPDFDAAMDAYLHTMEEVL